jgi:peptide/nickel transport system permease protein
MVGFSIFAFLLMIVIFYPLFVTDSPLQIIGQGTFFPPGVYVNLYDSLNTTKYTLNLSDAAAKRIDAKLGDQERQDNKRLAGVGRNFGR